MTTRVQELEIREGEIKVAMNDELDKAAEDRTEGKVEQLRTELRSVTTDLLAARELEANELPAPTTDNPEQRELREIRQRVRVEDYYLEVFDGKLIDGAAAEYRSAMLGKEDRPSMMPLAMLMDADELHAPPDPEREVRVDAVTGITTAAVENQATIAGRVFNASATAYLGAMMPTVQTGDYNYPHISAGTSADVRSPSQELDGTAATVTVEKVSPVRLTASYTFTRESLTRVEGIESSLQADLRAAMQEKLDSLVINGQAASGSTSPAIEGILNTITKVDATAVSTWADFLSEYAAAVDGKAAATAEGVRLLVGPAMYKFAYALQIATSGQLLQQFLPPAIFRASGAIPAVASDKQPAIRYANTGPRPGMVVPTWAGLEIVTDRTSRAKAGEVVMTAIQLSGWKLVDDAKYGHIEFQNA